MRRLPSVIVLYCACFFAGAGVHATEKLHPYVLAWQGVAGLDTVVENTRRSLQAVGFELVGQYRPLPDAYVLVVSAPLLQKIAAAEVNAAFLAAQSVAITRLGDRVRVSYRNPYYYRLAYRVSQDVTALAEALEASLGMQAGLGSEEGLAEGHLSRYQYGYGMEHFDDQLLLCEFSDQVAALKALEAGFAEHSDLVGRVYRLDLQGARASVFGVAFQSGEGSDARVHEVLDGRELNHATQLPYEVVVRDGQVRALHPRFRLALNFPDVKMIGERSFTRLRNAPDEIHAALRLLCGGR